MPHISLIWIGLTFFSQATQTPATRPASPVESSPSAATKAADPTNPAKPVATTPPAGPVSEPETAADKLLNDAAAKMDKLQFVSSDIVQTIRLGEDRITLKGEYKRGSKNRMKLLLKVQLGDSVGERLQICDGKLGYIYDKVIENEQIRQFRIDQIVALLERKELPPPVQRQVLTQLPYLLPGDMLRGFVSAITFTKVTKGELRGGRRVAALEGHWRAPVVNYLANGQPSATVETLPEGTPQYIKVYLDDATGWPLAIEMFRRDKTAEYHPVFTFEFSNIKFPTTLPDSEFAFTPPKKLTPKDETTSLISVLNSVPDKKGAKATPGSNSVSEPIAPAKPAAKSG